MLCTNFPFSASDQQNKSDNSKFQENRRVLPNAAQRVRAQLKDDQDHTEYHKLLEAIHKDDYDLSMVYVDTLKKAAKEFGPNSKEAIDELAVIDEVLQVGLHYTSVDY